MYHRRGEALGQNISTSVVTTQVGSTTLRQQLLTLLSANSASMRLDLEPHLPSSNPFSSFRTPLNRLDRIFFPGTLSTRT